MTSREHLRLIRETSRTRFLSVTRHGVCGHRPLRRFGFRHYRLVDYPGRTATPDPHASVSQGLITVTRVGTRFPCGTRQESRL